KKLFYGVRGIPFDVWDKSKCGSNLIIKGYGKVVKASEDCKTYQSVRIKFKLTKNGIYKWSVIPINITPNDVIYVGVCPSEYFDCEGKPRGWMLSSSGHFTDPDVNSRFYCESFCRKKVTVCLDMNKKTLTFIINGRKQSEVNIDIKSTLTRPYSVVSLRSPIYCKISPK